MQKVEGACPGWNDLVELEPRLRVWLGRHCRDTAELDDVVQETLIRAARYCAQSRPPRELEPWLARVARNVLCDWVRREGRARRLGEPQQDLDEVPCRTFVHESPSSGGEEAYRMGDYEVCKETALAELSLALRQVREDDRRLLETYYSEGSEGRSLSEALGLAPNVAKVRIFRARRRLARVLAARLALVGQPVGGKEATPCER